MKWTNEPEFNDAFAKKRLRWHNAFGGNVVSILYGAKDENGNPVEAREDANDGHGKWTGIECNGQYLMFTWEHSAEEGGAVEQGTEYGAGALAKMEKDLDERKDIVRSVEMIANSPEGEDAVAKIAELKEKLASYEDWGTPKDAELAKRLAKADAKFATLNEEYKANRDAKQAIVDQANALLENTNFKAAKNEIHKLMDQLDEVASAGEDTDESMLDQIHNVEREIRAKEKEYFANMDANRASAKEKKEELIEKSAAALKNVTNWKETGAQLNSLFDEWKAAGSAGKDVDDELWEKFNGYRKEFNEKRQQFFDDRNAKWNASIEKKEGLIAKAKEIVAQNNFSKALTDQMKALDVEWKSAGFSGREKNDALWDEYQKVKKVFWDGKSAIRKNAIQADLDKVNADLAKAEKEVEDLQYRLTIEDKPSLKDEFERKIDADKAKIEIYNAQKADLEKKLAD